ncbi:MAG: polysaccharide biosynthesis/export family protein [Sedimentisphaerales bacterium]|jgi:polysaccharide export outer membrane protein
MKKIKTASSVISLLALCVCAVGCDVKFWDPTQVGRFKPVPAVNVILDSLGVAEETSAAWEAGEDPKPADVVAYDTDYVFGPGDAVNISIFELFQEGALYSNQFVITETGKLSIPDVGVVNAGGLTESQLEEEIKQILSPNILKSPSVTVVLFKSQSRLFSILGNGVPKPGLYDIPRYDYRLADALAIAGGISQFNISYIYVSRPITGKETSAETAPPSTETPKADTEKAAPPPAAPPAEKPDEMLDVIAPMANRGAGNNIVIASTEMATANELDEAALPETLQESEGSNQTDRRPVSPTSPPSSANEGRIEWIFQDGRWIPVQVGEPQKPQEQVGQPKQPPQAAKEPAPATAGWEQIGSGGTQRRIIRVPADKLLGGDPRYNIVIRPSDTIHVPVDIIGEFCIMGNVNNQGFVNITGRPMTLKMAIASAGGLGQLAWPKNCEVVRRIGKKREEIVMVDLDKIATGEQPDFFIKPNDLINVGTHPSARWRAVLRNAFRATYGFGFVYDRNFVN